MTWTSRPSHAPSARVVRLRTAARAVVMKALPGVAVLGMAGVPALAAQASADASPRSAPSGATAAPAPRVQLFQTSGQSHFAPVPVQVQTQQSTASSKTIFINDSIHYQAFKGVGAAMTNASAYLLSKLAPSLSSRIVYDMFSPHAAGAHFLRVPIGASDFNVGGQIFTNDDMPPGHTDFALRHFTFAHDAHVITFTKLAQQYNPSLETIAMPWSMPAWMKTSHNLLNWNGYIDGRMYHSGGLIPGYEKVYARYLATWAIGMHKRGVRIDLLGIENEPGNQNNSYPAADLTPQQEAKVAGFLQPLLRAAHLPTRVYVYDSGWKGIDWIRSVLRGTNAPGIFVHCYGGSATNLTTIHDLFPTKDLILSECALQDIGFENAAQLMIEVARNWASGGLTWNFVLTDQGLPKTPHDANCGLCRGTDTVHVSPRAADVAAGLVTVSPNRTLVGYSRETYDLEAFGHFVEPGATRVFSTHAVTYSTNTLQESSGVDNVVFRNPPDRTALGGKDVMVAYNNTNRSQPVTVRDGSLIFSFTAAPNATVVAVIGR